MNTPIMFLILKCLLLPIWGQTWNDAIVQNGVTGLKHQDYAIDDFSIMNISFPDEKNNSQIHLTQQRFMWIRILWLNSSLHLKTYDEQWWRYQLIIAWFFPVKSTDLIPKDESMKLCHTKWIELVHAGASRHFTKIDKHYL